MWIRWEKGWLSVTPEETFGRVLRELRQQRGLSQEALAHESGAHRTYISFLERGQKSPTLRTIFAIAAVLEIRPSDLVRLVEVKTKSVSLGEPRSHMDEAR